MNLPTWLGKLEEVCRLHRQMNREILDTAPAMFISLLRYKAEEAHTQ